jgi:Fe2+ transport system protein FeoA
MTDKRTALADVPAGETVRVFSIEGGRGIHDRLQAIGIRAGIKLTKVSDSFAHGPIVIRHGQTQTALGRGICQKILVEAV